MVDFSEDIKNCMAVLQQGGTIVYPTDTVWGIGCDATSEAAVEQVFALKQRPLQKSMIILLADARDILQYVAAPPPDIIDLVERFDTPTTVIYSHALGLAANAVSEDDSVAIRVTTDPFCKALIKRFRKPLISTSANLSGQPTPALFPQISGPILAGAGYVVRHRQDDTTIRSASRIVRMDDEGNLTVLR